MLLFFLFQSSLPLLRLKHIMQPIFGVDGKMVFFIILLTQYGLFLTQFSCRYVIMLFSFRACCCGQGLNDSWPWQPLTAKEQQFQKPHFSQVDFYTWLWHACAPSAPKLPTVLTLNGWLSHVTNMNLGYNTICDALFGKGW